MSLGNVGGDTPHSFLPPTQQSAKRSSYETWTTEDNILLLTGYFHVSNDSELGNNQKGETFWGKITQYVNENAKSGKERIVSRCHSHFKDINRNISSFIGCYSTACREKRSGGNASGSSGSKRKSSGEDVESSTPTLVRPEGRDVAKKKARGSSSKTSVSRKSKGAIEEELSKLVSAHEKFEEKRSSTASAMNNLAHSNNMEMYRMKRPLFLRIVDSISNYDDYFTQRRNNAGKLGLTPIQKCTAAIRMLAYGVAADACDEYVKIGESTAIECTRKFCEGVIALFQDEYLRRPNVEDLQRLLQVGQERGFPGMIGSIDCMHWQWKNCPKAWQGQFTSGHKGTATVILEAVASYDLWIWHAFLGLPDSLNNINVLDRSPVFDDIESGEAPRVNFTVNGREYNLAYYLADGIYPK
ncbi:uncharacterized protein LOC109838163 [Asparagus officinalis]|uniref:uncharacterized protein LOC109838163 n=1 Tax=Asparagus officinalis TaxID=4686 RepID=UPI00098E01C1|nr:uncharacterized protein LOC109838163 [Asparagus officinalis]